MLCWYDTSNETPSSYLRQTTHAKRRDSIPRYLITQQATSSIYNSPKTFSFDEPDASQFQYKGSKENTASYSSATSKGYQSSKDTTLFADNPLIQKGFRFEKPYQSKNAPQKKATALSAPDYQVGDTVTVEFEAAGTKKMMAGFAKLTKM